MEQPQDKSIIDFILKDHKRRFEEAEILCRNRSFFPSRRPPHVCAEAISSTPKRPPSTSTETIIRQGKCEALLAVLDLGKVSLRSAAAAAGVAPSTLRDAKQRLEETGSAEPRKRGRKNGSKRLFDDESIEGLQYFIDLNPIATLKEMREFLTDSYNITPDISTISKLLKNLKITNKKVVSIPAARNTPLLSQKRVEWALTWRDMERFGVKFIYLDEAGFNLRVVSGKGWGVVGYTPEIEMPTNRGQNISLIAALIPGRKIESYSIQRGAMTGERIVEWMQSNLFPHLRIIFPGKTVVIIMDNAKCHSVIVQTCITENNYRFLKTVPYSPQTNPIERVFSQVKSFVARRTPADGIQLMAQIEEGVKSVSPEQTINYLKAHWGVLSDILRGIQPGSDHVVAFIEGK